MVMPNNRMAAEELPRTGGALDVWLLRAVKACESRDGKQNELLPFALYVFNECNVASCLPSRKASPR